MRGAAAYGSGIAARQEAICGALVLPNIRTGSVDMQSRCVGREADIGTHDSRLEVAMDG